MKKIFTLLVVAMTAMSSMAANYTDSLTVTVNGQSVEQHATISVDKDQDGLLTFSLNNFILSMGGQEMGIGVGGDGDQDGLAVDRVVDIGEGHNDALPLTTRGGDGIVHGLGHDIAIRLVLGILETGAIGDVGAHRGIRVLLVGLGL